MRVLVATYIILIVQPTCTIMKETLFKEFEFIVGNTPSFITPIDSVQLKSSNDYCEYDIVINVLSVFELQCFELRKYSITVIKE